MRLRNYVNNVLATATGQPLPKVPSSASWIQRYMYLLTAACGSSEQCQQKPHVQKIGSMMLVTLKFTFLVHDHGTSCSICPWQ